MNRVNSFIVIVIMMGLAAVCSSCQVGSSEASRRNLELLHAAYMSDIMRRGTSVHYESVSKKTSNNTIKPEARKTPSIPLKNNTKTDSEPPNKENAIWDEADKLLL